ncbi:hypothetical protein C2845_PM11G08650 [Panicum miliaceum]|uniref:Uncharacterized protein n=1 Tax=Panicum miliaceum TaxID=4540 RepID=A0A3L6RQS6_PANMI|nr:hypothetical protein C2845_PM11G08650 [Panicum miliaceum]
MPGLDWDRLFIAPKSNGTPGLLQCAAPQCDFGVDKCKHQGYETLKDAVPRSEVQYQWQPKVGCPDCSYQQYHREARVATAFPFVSGDYCTRVDSNDQDKDCQDYF